MPPSSLLIPLGVGGLAVPAGVGVLRRAGCVRANWRGRELAFPGGAAVATAGALALAAACGRRRSATLGRAGVSDSRGVTAYVLGISAAGLVDDLAGVGGPRGIAGHLGALRAGRPSTGLVKAAGALALAPLAVRGAERPTDRGLAALVLLLATHVGNLLDLRPGRAIKALLILGGALTLGTGRPPPEPIPAFLGPVLAFFPYDLRERAMLGDTGSGLVGALAGLWLVAALGRAGRALAAFLLAALTLYGEMGSISASIERIPGLRHLDSIGRAYA